jgi:hypothetical protein
VTLSALSWDNADWNWKHNHDTGHVYEQLFAADLSKSKRSAASIRSTPTPGCRRTRSAASSPRAGMEAESAAHGSEAAQGRHVPGQARRDGGA